MVRKEQIEKELNQIIGKFRMVASGNSEISHWDIDVLEKGIKLLRDYKEKSADDSAPCTKPSMKEITNKILTDFMNGNRDTPINVYYKDAFTKAFLGGLTIPCKKTYISGINCNKDVFRITWEVAPLGADYIVDRDNFLMIPYDEVKNCYQYEDKLGVYEVNVVLKCGVAIEFECWENDI